jgi:mono/diheme cytochrome c family protein
VTEEEDMNVLAEKHQASWRWLVTCFVVLLSAAAAAQTAEPGPPGKALYLRYCSACHGATGKGDGVVSGFLRPKPTDLTQIAKKAGGKFPFVQTMQAIDGTATVRAHGDPDMPVWGDSFRREARDTMDAQVEVRGRLMLITEYVESLQEK